MFGRRSSALDMSSIHALCGLCQKKAVKVTAATPTAHVDGHRWWCGGCRHRGVRQDGDGADIFAIALGSALGKSLRVGVQSAPRFQISAAAAAAAMAAERAAVVAETKREERAAKAEADDDARAGAAAGEDAGGAAGTFTCPECFEQVHAGQTLRGTAPIQSALQQSILETGSSVVDM